MLSAIRDSLLRAYARLPEHPGKYRIVSWLGRNAFPPEGIVARVHPDVKLLLHPQDWIEYLLLRGDSYEPLTLAFLARNLHQGETAVLAGVNIGLHVAVAAMAVGDEGQVVGVEPQPGLTARALRNLQLNRLDHRVTFVSAALGSKADLVRMAWPVAGNSGSSSLFDPGDGPRVAVLPTSQVFDAVCRRPPRLFLLDVEGFEGSVLSGLAGTLLPAILVVEAIDSNLARDGGSVSKLLHQIKSLGYALSDLRGNDLSGDECRLLENNVVGVREGVQVSWDNESP